MSLAGPGKRRLGRGLDGLLPVAAPAEGARLSAAVSSARIEELAPNAQQPRDHFDEQALEELTQSIREMGILEPILVRRTSTGATPFEIVAGERRWRASQRAGLKEVPIYVRELSDEHALEAALVENLQREDLNPIETARAMNRLVVHHQHTQESVAERVGKSRTAVTNALRLLKLPPEVIDLMEDGRLSEGHGRAILGAADVSDMRRIAREAAARHLSVRETERLARAASRKTATTSTGEKAAVTGKRTANVRDLEERLSMALGTRVHVRDRRGKGRLEVHYGSYDELDRLLDRLLS